MYEYRCSEYGMIYYDPVVCAEQKVTNTLLFLIGYARVFGDTKVSDKLYIPHAIFDSEGNLIALPNRTFHLNARNYLNSLSRVEVLDNGDLFELYGLTEILESIGFYNDYVSSSEYNKNHNRVPHVPMFTHRSQDYKRISDILTQEVYWNKEEHPSPSDGLQEKYGIYNTSYLGYRGESIDPYISFGSREYMDTLYPNPDNLPVNEYKDYCSKFIWDSLAFTSLYQFSSGVLYGMSQVGWGMLPYMQRPKYYAPYFRYIKYIDEAHFWFINTPLALRGYNQLINIDSAMFYYNTADTLD